MVRCGLQVSVPFPSTPISHLNNKKRPRIPFSSLLSIDYFLFILRGHFLQKNLLSAWEASLSFCNVFRSPKQAGEQDSMRQAIMHDCNNLYAKWLQSCPTLCNPLCSSVHGILQARILESVAISSSRGSPFELH